MMHDYCYEKNVYVPNTDCPIVFSVCSFGVVSEEIYIYVVAFRHCDIFCLGCKV